jgi:hypothetical protein
VLKKRFAETARKTSFAANSTFTDNGNSIITQPSSLINQQSAFGYNEDGSRKVNPFGTTNVYQKHAMMGTPRGIEMAAKANLQHRLNLHFQNVRDSDVAFITT